MSCAGVFWKKAAGCYGSYDTIAVVVAMWCTALTCGCECSTIRAAPGCPGWCWGLRHPLPSRALLRGQRENESGATRVAACRYEVIKASGKGVFSNVVTATDKLRQNSEGINPLVAIKVIRANDTMYKAGKLELQILTKVAEADPENRRHVIRLLRSFEYRHHLCMVRSPTLLVLPERLPPSRSGPVTAQGLALSRFRRF